jgi:two-component system sensor histidine kinase HydH
VVGRALALLALSGGAALLLTVAALILAAKARQAERTEAQLSAQRHLARLGEMSAVLAHEIRNPLAALKGHAQLLAEEVAEPAVARAATASSRRRCAWSS